MISCASLSVIRPALEVALEIDIQEGGGAAQAHGGAVLLLDGGKIAEVQPLNGLLRVLRPGWEMSKP